MIMRDYRGTFDMGGTYEQPVGRIQAPRTIAAHEHFKKPRTRRNKECPMENSEMPQCASCRDAALYEISDGTDTHQSCERCLDYVHGYYFGFSTLPITCTFASRKYSTATPPAASTRSTGQRKGKETGPGKQ